MRSHSVANDLAEWLEEYGLELILLRLFEDDFKELGPTLRDRRRMQATLETFTRPQLLAYSDFVLERRRALPAWGPGS
jgi:hypothetical protein